MSLKRFLGWEPAEFTEVVEWAGSGSPKRWVTRRDVEWDDKQRLWMLALAHYEASLCRKCGHPLDETTDPGTDPDNPQNARRWVAEIPTPCYCCAVLAKSERKAGKDAEGGKARIPPEALIHTAVLVAHKPRRPKRRTGGEP